MQLSPLVLLVALFGSALAQTLPTFFVLAPGSTREIPTKIFLNAGQTYTVAVGSNVTFGCQHTDSTLRIMIGKWSVNPLNAKLFPLNANGETADAFDDIGAVYPALASRIAASVFLGPPRIVYLHLINIMPYDIGNYGCYGYIGTTVKTPVANITIGFNSSDIYGARMVSADQQITVEKPSSAVASTPSTYDCTIYRAKDVPYVLWFDKCQLSQLGQDLSFANRNLTCSNKPSALTRTLTAPNQYATGVGQIVNGELNKAVVADMYPMGTGPAAGGTIFWQKDLYTDTFSIRLSADMIYSTTNSWLNTSLGCFAYNNATSKAVRDYITFVQPGVDLELDPTVISCTRHHFVAAPGSTVRFYCVVQQPLYRGDAAISWEIMQASQAGGPYKNYTVSTQNDANSFGMGKVVQVSAPTIVIATVSGAQQKQAGAALNVTVDTASTVFWRFRLVAKYSDSSSSYSRSEFFSVATSEGTGIGGSKPGTQTGASKSSAPGILSSLVLLISVVAISLLLSVM